MRLVGPVLGTLEDWKDSCCVLGRGGTGPLGGKGTSVFVCVLKLGLAL